MKENTRDYVLWGLTVFVICSFVCLFLLNTRLVDIKKRQDEMSDLQYSWKDEIIKINTKLDHLLGEEK
jgi:hydrogenase-4 membrane subunit HyfE